MIEWIGQHIWDFVSRFRNDVYLENIADGTVASDKFLGLDSNNKIVKEAASATVTDLHSAGVDGSANQLLTDDGDGTVTSEANLVFHNDALTLTSTSAAGRPHLTLQNDETSSASPILQFEKTATGADDDDLGRIIFKGDDEGDGSHTYANILGEIADATPGEEAGRLSFQVAEYNGTVTTGVLINGDTDADGEVDVTIGSGTLSTTTIAGKLNITRDFTLDSVTINAVQTASESFADNDTSLMTSAAIDDRINAAGGGGADGWHGSTSRIKLLHRDFIADDSGRPLLMDDTGAASENFFLESNASAPMYATVAIPTGFKATHVMVYGSATDAVEVWEHQINSKTGVSKGTGNVDTEINITDVTSSTTNYLFIQVANASGNEVHGGYVTIAAV